MSQEIGLNRSSTLDKYYTKDYIASQCVDKVKEFLDIDEKCDIVIEPSAGDGVFIPFLKGLSQNTLFIDISPGHPEVVCKDFLTYTPFEEEEVDEKKNENKEDKEDKEKEKLHIVGNPPFGRQSSLAIQFIKHACLIASSVSFILPKSFKKESMRKKFDSYFHMVYEEDLPENSFLVNGEEYNVPCVFQIWEKREVPREMKEKLVPAGFEFVKKEDDPDVAFRRVGVYAGTFHTEIEEKSVQSHYFIRFDRNIRNIRRLIGELKKITFAGENTVGPKSVSKQELLEKMNAVMETYMSV